MSFNQRPGHGVRPLGYESPENPGETGEEEVEETESETDSVPEVVEQVDEWLRINGTRKSSTAQAGTSGARELTGGSGVQREERDRQGGLPMVEALESAGQRSPSYTFSENARDRERRYSSSRSRSRSPLYSSESSAESREGRCHKHSHRHRRHRKRRDSNQRHRDSDRRRRDSSRRRSHRHRRERHDSASGKSNNIATLWKSWSLPELKDDLKHDELRLAWPTWRDMLMAVLDLNKPMGREWSEKEKYLTLMMYGGQHVREVASFTAPVTGEFLDAEPDKEPKFSNLVTRCNASFRARDPTMEITILRAMHQKKDESVREFLDKARKQISLCGYRTAEERDRELVLLLKQNSLDAIGISKQATGQSLEQMEALAINLEGIRQREQREKGDKAAKKEEGIFAVMDKFHAWQKTSAKTPNEQKLSFSNQQSRGGGAGSSRTQTQNSGSSGDCVGCGRVGGHDQGRKCYAADLECSSCGRKGHVWRVCKSRSQGGAGRGSAGRSGDRSRPRGRVNQVLSRERKEGGGREVNTIDDEWSS